MFPKCKPTRIKGNIYLPYPPLSNRQEGFHAFYKGITPRIMRVAPGQAVTFTVYEFLRQKLESSNVEIFGGNFEE